MPHHAAHAASRVQSRRSLLLALAVTGVWFLVELAAGLYANSMALIADAAHMLTDLAALSLSVFAIRIAERPATRQKTYGYLRAEILAALVNGIFLVLVALYILYESYHRLQAPPAVKSGAMLPVAVLGLAVNLVTMMLLRRSRHECLNVRGAFLHVMGDTLGSIGAIVAGILMLFREWYLADPLVSCAVALLVMYSSWELVRDSVDVLLEGAPRSLDVGRILEDLGRVDGVASVHDLHVWSITSGMPALSCHVVLRRGSDAPEALAGLSALMREKHGIEHTTIQIEDEGWVSRPTQIS